VKNRTELTLQIRTDLAIGRPGEVRGEKPSEKALSSRARDSLVENCATPSESLR